MRAASSDEPANPPATQLALRTLLLAVEGSLESDMDLDGLARRSGYSPFHFHRIFSAAIGETPKQHLTRLRLERAAYLLAVTNQRVLAIALEVGFASHETFTRSFRRRFGLAPTAYRAAARRAQAERLVRNLSFSGDGCRLSAVRFGYLPPVRLLAIRRVGAYETLLLPPYSAADRLWTALVSRAARDRILYDPTPWVICYDDPTLTPAASQRLDACIATTGRVTVLEPPFRWIDFGGGHYAGADHEGPYDTIDQAYRHVADGIRRSSRYAFDSGPPLQVFRHVGEDRESHRTEVYFPVKLCGKPPQDSSRNSGRK